MNKPVITIYACGGAGINVAQYFQQYRNKTNPGFAEIKPVYIDTSRSNINTNIPEDDIYLVEGLDGSGKVRAENHTKIAECVQDVLLTFKPTNLSIVISSLSGGSGSVIAPLLVSELLSRKENVIVIGIASTDSRIEIENSIKSLKSYESFAKRTAEPVPMLYYLNNQENSRSTNNSKIQQAITLLAVLFSGENKELDSTDLRNWLHYTKVTKADPKLVYISVVAGTVAGVNGQIITCATLGRENANTSPGSTVDYQCVGFVQENNSNFEFKDALHYLVLDNVITTIFGELDKMLNEQDQVAKAKMRNVPSILSDKDRPTNDGLIL